MSFFFSDGHFDMNSFGRGKGFVFDINLFLMQERDKAVAFRNCFPWQHMMNCKFQESIDPRLLSNHLTTDLSSETYWPSRTKDFKKWYSLPSPLARDV